MRSLRPSLAQFAVATGLVLSALAAAPAALAATPPTPTDILNGSNWDVPSNWSAGHVPGPSDVALVNNQATVNAADGAGALELADNARLLGSGSGSLSVGSGGLWESISNASELNVIAIPVTVAGPAYLTGDLLVNDVLTLDGATSITGSVSTSVSSFPSAKVVNGGTIDINGGGLGGKVVNNGTIRADAVAFGSGRDCLCGTPTTNFGTIDLLDDPTLSNQAAVSVTGPILNQGAGHIDVAAGARLWHTGQGNAPSIVLNGGELTGNGLIESGVQNVSGTVSPGGDGNVGTLTIEDPNGYGYVQGSGGTLRIDVRGSQPAAIDQLAVGGPLQLDGNLYVDSTGYTPTAGVDYQITQSFSGNTVDFQDSFTAAPSGTFANLTGPGAPLYLAVYYPSTAAASVILRAAQSKPAVTTGPASNITSSGATVSGTVNPLGSGVSAITVEYGPTTTYTGSVAASPSTLPAGSTPVPVSATLSGLPGGTLVHYRVVAANANGTSYGADQTFTTLAGAGPGPKLISAKQSNTTWKLGNKLPHFSRVTVPVGTTISFSLNEAALVTFTFSQQRVGRKVKNRCVSTTGKNRHKRRCTRSVAVGALTFTGHPGLNRVFFQGRLTKSKRLRPGHYTLAIVANASGKSSRTITLSFTIVP
jgi:hypothetical protein